MILGKYVVVKEPDIGFYRLRRADAVPDLNPEWRGDSLRAGYDAMIRLNLDRRYERWIIGYKQSKLRLFRSSLPDRTWTAVGWADGRLAAKANVKRYREEIASVLRRLNQINPSGKSRRLTASDRRYIDWRLRKALKI